MNQQAKTIKHNLRMTSIPLMVHPVVREMNLKGYWIVNWTTDKPSLVRTIQDQISRALWRFTRFI